jgi:predicted transcriptional regulator
MAGKKVTVNLGDEVVQALNEIATTRGVTMTEALRQAIANEKFLQDEINQGSRILIEDKERNVQRVVFK